MVQHLRSKTLSLLSLLRIQTHLWFQIISMTPSNRICLALRFLISPSPLSIILLVIIGLIHPPIIHIVSILNTKPRVLPNIVTKLLRFQTYYVIRRCLLMINPSLIHLYTLLPIVWQFRTLLSRRVLPNLIISLRLISRLIWFDWRVCTILNFIIICLGSNWLITLLIGFRLRMVGWTIIKESYRISNVWWQTA